MKWTTGSNGDKCAKNHAIICDNNVIAKVYGMGYPIGEGWSAESEAIARLIAAAPELLTVAHGAFGYFLSLPNKSRYDENLLATLRTAIAKAEGK